MTVATVNIRDEESTANDGEYEEWTSSLQDFKGEESDFGNEIGGKCRVLMTALKFADASHCIKEAWSGTYDKGLALYQTSDDLRGDTDHSCRASL